MKAYQALTFVLCYTLCATTLSSAQTTKDHTIPDARMKVTVEDLSGGRTLFTVQNRSSQPITALALEAVRTLVPPKRGSNRSVRYFDSIVNLGHDSELMPYQTHTFVIFGKSPSPSEASRDVELKATLFADGTAYGDPAWIKTLLDRRTFLSNCLANLTQKLSAAIAENEPTQSLVADLGQEEAVQMKDAASLDERVIANTAYESAIHYLSTSSSSNDLEANRIQTLIEQYRNHQAALAHALPAI